jgi:hypothetical protein
MTGSGTYASTVAGSGAVREVEREMPDPLLSPEDSNTRNDVDLERKQSHGSA